MQIGTFKWGQRLALEKHVKIAKVSQNIIEELHGIGIVKMNS
jgi:hypothetical protein